MQKDVSQPVHRPPFTERIKAYFDPHDWLIWILEELNDDAFDEWLALWVTPIGISANVIFVLARGASASGSSTEGDDVFGEDITARSGWFRWMATTLVYILTVVCCANALFTFLRKRTYRLFEHPIDIVPATPSARRVPVDQSTLARAPLQLVWDVLSTVKSYFGLHSKPSAEREVWEVNVWNPRLVNLNFFTLFSPGHLLLYFAMLPPPVSNPRPSVIFATALAFGTLLSLQLSLLNVSFSRQAKDHTLLHSQVMNEYDTKFVRPTLNRPVRNVGTQTTISSRPSSGGLRGIREVEIYTPTTIVNRGFHVNPNEDYADDYNPKHFSVSEEEQSSSRRVSSSGFDGMRMPRSALSTPNLLAPKYNHDSHAQTTSSAFRAADGTRDADFSSPIKPRHERVARSSHGGLDGRLGVSPAIRAIMADAKVGKDSPSSHVERRRMTGRH